MFRKPADTSSDSSDESSLEEVVQAARHSIQEDAAVLFGEDDLSKTETLSTNDSFSVADADGSLANVDHHRNMILVSLLEDFYKTRAAELANNANGESIFTRESREIQPLAKRML